MCEAVYEAYQFNHLAYHQSSFGDVLYTAETVARASYYAVSGIPQINFDGSTVEYPGGGEFVGAGADAADGHYYIAYTNAHLTDSVPLAVGITDYSYESGSAFVTVKVMMVGDLGASPTNTYIRVVLAEDQVTSGGNRYDKVVRDVLPQTALTVSMAGQVQEFTLPMTINAAWNVDELSLVAFVQRDSDKYIYNSGSSLVGEYAAVAGASGPQQVIADGSQIVFDPATVLNVGMATDTFDVSIDTANLPDGWDAHLVYNGADYATFTVTLAPFESASFNVVMDTGTTGSGAVDVDVFSQGGGEIVDTLVFAGLAGGTDFLVVADDGGAGFGYTAYGPAITGAGKTFAVWDRGLAVVTGADLLDYDAVIWETGANSNVIAATDKTAIDAYLAAGGRLILAGEDLLQGAVANGYSAWIQLKLRFSYGSADSGNRQVNGVAGDPIGNGLSFTLSAGDPDQINLIAGQPAEACFRFGNTGTTPAGIRTTYSTYMVVTLPWGLERVPLEADRNEVLVRSLQWLGVLDALPVEELPGAGLALAQNAPNPFNPATKISFRTGQNGPARLDVFNARGQLVRVLVDGELAAGQYEAIWDGKTQTGQQAASGTYFYRLSTTDERLTRKMTLVK
ncbi:MAG TPA: FlgD immunoglobulin-like domain containing protein [Candidatus Krumholzibacteria bacterium]|nr:FlgD immunoglobulin-like domain containing protein [Candidatus Krumholzibacteria bacterium]HPD72463.1 FlgD immunoglobulin-like domain containing protein [Candidatus Krumholzibacteria bacterium]HRY40605.1 FlgD immunoglobulin-like domain containing protein [Candidatus Krumholzibacteria bacterium]